MPYTEAGAEQEQSSRARAVTGQPATRNEAAPGPSNP